MKKLLLAAMICAPLCAFALNEEDCKSIAATVAAIHKNRIAHIPGYDTKEGLIKKSTQDFLDMYKKGEMPFLTFKSAILLNSAFINEAFTHKISETTEQVYDAELLQCTMDPTTTL